MKLSDRLAANKGRTSENTVSSPSNPISAADSGNNNEKKSHSFTDPSKNSRDAFDNAFSPSEKSPVGEGRKQKTVPSGNKQGTSRIRSAAPRKPSSVNGIPDEKNTAEKHLPSKTGEKRIKTVSSRPSSGNAFGSSENPFNNFKTSETKVFGNTDENAEKEPVASSENSTDSLKNRTREQNSNPFNSRPASAQPWGNSHFHRNDVIEEPAEEIKETPKLTEEEELELEYIKEHRRAKEKQKRFKMATRITNISLILACIYLIFLIYGVICTNYGYSDKGEVVAEVMSIEDIKNRNEFNIILTQYVRARMLYEKVLMIDYRLSQGIEDSVVLATEYESLLNEVSDLSLKTDALEVAAGYSQIKNLILSWVKNDCALYLQFVSEAILENNGDKANQAVLYKDAMYNDFSLITSNIISMGSPIRGVDLTDIKKWTPEDYVLKQITGESK